MGRFFWARVRQWERTSQLALALDLILLLVTLGVVFWGPESWRQPALIGLFGLVLVAQGIVMWANRGMVTAYTQAQRLYLDEDFAGACAILEEIRASGKARVRDLTLLGNAYRQRALLDQSEAVLQEALRIQPNLYFPQYGFGRTLLVQGRYAEAIRALETALDLGAPQVVRLDAGEAYFRLGQYDEATALIETGLAAARAPYRRLMGTYLLYVMSRAAAPEPTLLADGLLYWQAQAQRYHFTAYGQALSGDLYAMQALVEEA